MRWLIRAYTLILLAYTGWRTWDFISSQLPDNETGVWLAILFLFSAEAGLALWHEVSISHTTTYVQHNIATWLTWVDFAASLGAGIADMIIRQTMTDYMIPGWLAMGLIFGLPAIVAINVAGALIFLANDAEAQLDREKRFLIFEATRQAIKELGAHRSSIVKERKSEIAAALRGDAISQIERDYINPKSAGKVYNQELPAITDTLPANPTKRRQTKKV